MYTWEDLFIKRQSKKDGANELFKNISFKPNFKIINVVGTNGKGSISNYISQHISHCDYKVGLFTSPHLIDPTERIKINDVNISEDEFWNIYKKYKVKFDEYSLGFFQIMYTVACIYFQKHNCKFVIMEAGIGGTYDVTNILNGEWGVVSSIGHDHSDILGYTLEDISKDKAGIINKGMKFFIPTTLNAELINIFIKQCQKVNATYELVDCFGNYQKRNIQLAKQIGKSIVGKDYNDFVHPIGRSQLINWKDKLITIDVGHNLEALENSWEIISDDYDLIIFYSKRSGQQLEDMQKYLKSKGNLITFRKEKELKKIFDLMKNKKRILLIGSFVLIGYFLKEIRNAN